MTDLEKYLASVKQRAESATEGQWEVARSNDRTAADIFVEETALICEMSNATVQNEQMQTNADFIAHARTDVPRLVEMVEELIIQRNAYMYQPRQGDFKEHLDRQNEKLNKISRGEK